MSRPETIRVTLCLIVLSVVPGCLCQHGLDEYNYTEYPNTLADYELCGREVDDKPIYVCDPNKILNEDDAQQLDVLIETVMNETECRCSALVCSQSDSPGYRVAVALVKKLKLPKKSDKSGDKISNDLKDAMGVAGTFSYHKLKDWGLGRCTEDVILLYSVMDGVLYSVTGDEAGQRLQPTLIGEIGLMRQTDLRKNVFNGLRLILSDYKSVFMGTYEAMPRERTEPKYEAVRGGATTPGSLLLATSLTFIITALSHMF